MMTIDRFTVLDTPYTLERELPSDITQAVCALLDSIGDPLEGMEDRLTLPEIATSIHRGDELYERVIHAIDIATDGIYAMFPRQMRHVRAKRYLPDHQGIQHFDEAGNTTTWTTRGSGWYMQYPNDPKIKAMIIENAGGGVRHLPGINPHEIPGTEVVPLRAGTIVIANSSFVHNAVAGGKGRDTLVHFVTAYET